MGHPLKDGENIQYLSNFLERKKSYGSPLSQLIVLTNIFYLFELFGCSGFIRWDETTFFKIFSHLPVMDPELGYLAKTYLLHHLADLPNYITLPPSVIPFCKALVQANKIL